MNAEAPAKLSLDGAQRAITPEETLARITPFFTAVGITRIADITALDRIGIPVALCVRPDSASLAVDSGKGFTIAAAKASAAMEGVERYTVEHATFQTRRCAAHCRPECEYHFPLLRGAFFNIMQEIDWVMCDDLFTGAEIFAPQRCVGLDCFGKVPITERAHYSTTNGLAAGNTREEAICAAIYEVIERDAVAIAISRDEPTKAIIHDSVQWPTLNALLCKIKAAGCGVTIIDCTSDINVPTFMAVIFDRAERGTGVFKGYGAHLSPEVAMCRAVCEAAQARAVIVAGARDDITHERHQIYLSASQKTDLSQWDLPQNTSATSHVDGSGRSFREDIGELMGRLEVAGINRMLMYDFEAQRTTGAHVVRILIPGLEGYFTPWVEMGERARR